MTTIHDQLLRAKDLFYAGRLNESYSIFRRYFDRLPFSPETGHADYIGYFVRILVELGKNNELKFYINEIERQWDRWKTPHLAYQMAMVNIYVDPPRMDHSISLLDEILRSNVDKELSAKAKMLLAYCYQEKKQLGMIRPLIYGIGPVSDTHLEDLVSIWKASVLRAEKKPEEAQAVLQTLLSRKNPKLDWYGFFSAQVLLIAIQMDQNQITAAVESIEKLRKNFEKNNFKAVQSKLKYLDELVMEKQSFSTVQLVENGSEVSLTYAGHNFSLDKESPLERLILFFIKAGHLSKEQIIQSLFGRNYNDHKDDKIIYSQIHSLRKRLRALRFPDSSIVTENDGYRFIPKVQLSRS